MISEFSRFYDVHEYILFYYWDWSRDKGMGIPYDWDIGRTAKMVHSILIVQADQFYLNFNV
jgi:hypothetical protein